jgi:hypothetical protein
MAPFVNEGVISTAPVDEGRAEPGAAPDPAS